MVLPVTSNSRTVNRLESTSGKSARMDFLTPSTSFLAVATIGTFVVWSRCLVSAWPMPRLAGETKHHAMILQLSLENTILLSHRHFCK
jgi:hypothetical protein